MNILEKINNSFGYLRKLEKKVANSIPPRVQKAIHLSIATLTKLANVSESAVKHFYCSMETKEFSYFRLQLAQSLINRTSYVGNLLDPDDTFISYRQKIVGSAITKLDILKDKLNSSSINRAINLLIHAKKIVFFALGYLVPVAHDEISKFFPFNISVIYFDDVMIQRIYCFYCRDSNDNSIIVFSKFSFFNQVVSTSNLRNENRNGAITTSNSIDDKILEIT